MSVNDADADTFDHLTQMVTGPMSRGQPEEHEGASDVSGCQTATGGHLRQLRLRLCCPQFPQKTHLIQISRKEFEKFRR